MLSRAGRRRELLSDTFVTCGECGAKCSPISKKCWLCNASLTSQRDVGAEPGDNTFVPARKERSPRANFGEQDENKSVDNISVAVLIASLLVIRAGIVYEAPGLGIMFAIIVVPALFAVLVKRERRMQSDHPADWGDTISDFLGAVGVTIGILVLLPVVAVIALLIFCAVMLASGGFR